MKYFISVPTLVMVGGCHLWVPRPVGLERVVLLLSATSYKCIFTFSPYRAAARHGQYFIEVYWPGKPIGNVTQLPDENRVLISTVACSAPVLRCPLLRISYISTGTPLRATLHLLSTSRHQPSISRAISNPLRMHTHHPNLSKLVNRSHSESLHPLTSFHE